MKSINLIIHTLLLNTRNGYRLSFPYIVNDGGEVRLACFSYALQGEGELCTVTAVDTVYLIDLEGETVNGYAPSEDCPHLPLQLSDLRSPFRGEATERLYAYLDAAFTGGDFTPEEYNRLFFAAETDAMKPLYQFFDAEFM